MFIFELVVQSIGMHKSYLFSFFFWMDALRKVRTVVVAVGVAAIVVVGVVVDMCMYI